MMSSRARAVLKFIMFALPAIMIMVLGIRGIKHGSTRASAPALDIYKPLFDKWKHQNFTPIDDTGEFKKHLAELKISSSSNLSKRQTENLYENLYRFVMSYHKCTFDSIVAIRDPLNNYKVAPFVESYLAKRNISSTPNPEDQIKTFLANVEPKVTGTNFWTGMAFDSTSISVENRTNKIEDLGQLVTKNENVGLDSITPMLVFGITPEEVLRKKSSITYATITTIMQNDDVSYPIYWRYYWCNDYDIWVPIEFATGYSGPRRYTLRF